MPGGVGILRLPPVPRSCGISRASASGEPSGVPTDATHGSATALATVLGVAMT
jgi:hypothetical protein